MDNLKLSSFLLMNSKEKRIDICKKTNNQNTVEDLARQKGQDNILELLEAWNLACTLQETIEVTEAKLKAEVEVVKFLLENSKKKEIHIYRNTAEYFIVKEGVHDNILKLMEAYTLQKTIEGTESKLKADKSRLETLKIKHHF